MIKVKEEIIKNELNFILIYISEVGTGFSLNFEVNKKKLLIYLNRHIVKKIVIPNTFTFFQ